MQRSSGPDVALAEIHSTARVGTTSSIVASQEALYLRLFEGSLPFGVLPWSVIRSVELPSSDAGSRLALFVDPRWESTLPLDSCGSAIRVEGPFRLSIDSDQLSGGLPALRSLLDRPDGPPLGVAPTQPEHDFAPMLAPDETVELLEDRPDHLHIRWFAPSSRKIPSLIIAAAAASGFLLSPLLGPTLRKLGSPAAELSFFALWSIPAAIAVVFVGSLRGRAWHLRITSDDAVIEEKRLLTTRRRHLHSELISVRLDEENRLWLIGVEDARLELDWQLDAPVQRWLEASTARHSKLRGPH